MRQAADVRIVGNRFLALKVLGFVLCAHLDLLQILASPAAMQIRQLDALQAMARNAGSKVVFGTSDIVSDKLFADFLINSPDEPLEHGLGGHVRRRSSRGAEPDHGVHSP